MSLICRFILMDTLEKNDIKQAYDNDIVRHYMLSKAMKAGLIEQLMKEAQDTLRMNRRDRKRFHDFDGKELHTLFDVVCKLKHDENMLSMAMNDRINNDKLKRCWRHLERTSGVCRSVNIYVMCVYICIYTYMYIYIHIRTIN
jgi:hypothetical protein